MTTAEIANYLYDLGFSLGTAVVNLLQVPINVIPILGKDTIRGLKYVKGYLRGDENIIKELYEAGILTEAGFEGAKGTGLKQILREAKKNPLKIRRLALYPFQMTELLSRIATYGAAKEYAKKHGLKGMKRVLEVLGVPKHDPIWKELTPEKFASEVVDKTLFRYEQFNAPKLLSTSTLKLALPYKTFLLNQLTLATKYYTNGLVKDPKTALLFTAVSVLLAGKYGNPYLLGAYELLRKLYEDTYGEDLDERLKKEGLGFLVTGVPAQVGLDIRTSVKLDIPNPAKPEEWLGRPFRTAYYYLRGEREKFESDIKPRFWKALEDVFEMWETGQLKDYAGRVIKEGITPKDIVLRLMTFRPQEYYEFLEKKRLIRALDEKWKKEFEPLFRDYTNALVSNQYEKAYEIRQELEKKYEELVNKFTKGKGITALKYLYLIRKYHSAIRGTPRRTRARTEPFSSDRSKRMILEYQP